MALTSRQRDILQFVVTHVEQNGYQPSFREIGKHFGITTPNGVRTHMLAMAKKGVVEMSGGSRAIRIKGWPNVKH